MKNLRNRNQPVNADLVQVYLQSSWDIVTAVYAQLANIEAVADAIGAGDLDNFLSAGDIDTLAELNAILTDANLGDAADFATAAQGALADTAIQGPFANQAEAEQGTDNTKAMTPLRVAQAIAFLGQNTLNNLDAITDPTVNDDTSQGYLPGSVWINTVTQESYRCIDNALGAAVWVKSTLTADELSAVALSGSSDDLIEGVTNLLLTVAERNKLAGIEPGATGDMTNGEIKIAYEANADTNAFTDALLGKLSGIEAGAQVNRVLASQAEAEAGAENTKGMTPLRVAQAISALASGGLAWSSANSSVAVVKNTGTVFYALGADVTATLPAAPAVGDSLMIVNNDSNALDAYDVIVTAGGSNEIKYQNITSIPSWNVKQGHTALLVCYDAGATKRWHITVWDSTLNMLGSAGGMTVVSTKIANYTANENEVVPVDSSAGSFTITMPASATAQSRVIVMDVGKACSLFPVTLGRNGATFDGLAEDFVIDQNNGRVDAVSNGTDDWATHLFGTPEAIVGSGTALEAEIDARVVAVASGVETWLIRPYDFTQVAGETTRVQIVTSGNNLDALNFPSSAGYHWAGFAVIMPQRWDGGLFRFRFGWVPSSTNTGDVEFGLYNGLQAVDGEAWNVSGWDSGNGMSVADTAQGTINMVHISPWSSWNNMNASVVSDGLNIFRLQRNKDNAPDTFTGDAKVFFVEVQWVSDAPTDA